MNTTQKLILGIGLPIVVMTPLVQSVFSDLDSYSYSPDAVFQIVSMLIGLPIFILMLFELWLFRTPRKKGG